MEYGLAFFMHRHRKYSERAVTRPQQLIEEARFTTASPRSGLVQQYHWSERGRVASVANADALGHPRRSVRTFGALRAETRHHAAADYSPSMSKTLESLASEAMDLPSDQRFALAHRILASVEPVLSPEVDAAWDAEIRDRIQRLDRGGARLVPAAEAFAEVERRLRR
ncbi:MAG: addiction module protein [Limisphaerales bacterium]